MIRNLFQRALHPKDKSSRLNVEMLEPRAMLSTVNIFASGETGEETMTVFAGQEVRVFENVPVEGQEYVIETANSLVNDAITIEFNNDLYLPEQGVDRNLTVEQIVVDGVVISTEAPDVFADGVWDPVENQITSGGGLGPTLHTNGFFDFFIEGSEVDTVYFAEELWQVVDGVGTTATLDSLDGTELIISGASGPLAISNFVDAQAGDIYQLAFNAERPILSGEFTSDSQPWATIGINYYGAAGQLISQDRVDVNFSGPEFVEREFQVPVETTAAYKWIWIDGFQDSNIPLELSNFSFEPLDVIDDTTPPTASFNSFTFEDNFEQAIYFEVLFEDDNRLNNVQSGVVTVTGPNGFNLTPSIVTGGPDNTAARQRLVFEFAKPNFTTLTTEDNGVYTVALNTGGLSDAAGNFASGRTLGTLTVNIPVLGEDVTAPVVTLSTASEFTQPPQGGRGSDISFRVDYVDDRPLNGFFDGAILVEGPNGYVGTGQGIAGGGAEPYGYFEITYIPLPDDGVWSANENGSYTITLLDDSVFDAAGNVTDGGLLGTFVVNIDDEVVVG